MQLQQYHAAKLGLVTTRCYKANNSSNVKHRRNETQPPTHHLTQNNMQKTMIYRSGLNCKFYVRDMCWYIQPTNAATTTTCIYGTKYQYKALNACV